MSLRKITGTFLNLEEQPVKNDQVKIRLVGGSYTPEAMRLSGLVIKRTSESGGLDVELWANGEGDVACNYEVSLPDGEVFTFVLPPGTEPLTWPQVRALGVPASDPKYTTLLGYIDNEIDDRLATGGVLPTDAEGNIIIDAGLL